MKIETKFDIGNLVWVIVNNRFAQLEIKDIEYSKEYVYYHFDEIKKNNPFPDSYLSIKEIHCFENRDNLIHFLKKETIDGYVNDAKNNTK